MDDRKISLAEMIEWVNTDLAYKPGWTVRAVRATTKEYGLTISATFEAPNSNRDLARQGYPITETVTPIPSLTIEWPEDGAEYHAAIELVFMFLVDIEIHEAREFFRVRSDDMAAPYHPHRWAGHARFQNMDAGWPTSFSDPLGDMDIQLHEEAQESTHDREMLDDYHAFMAQNREQGPDLSGLPPELVEMLQRAGVVEAPIFGDVGGDPLAGLFHPQDSEDPMEALMRQMFGGR